MKTLLIALFVLAILGIAGMAIFVFVVQNVETPNYQVTLAEPPYEVRDYPSMVVAEVTRAGERRKALSAGFSPLARYIFAKDREGAKVAMTAPVIQQPEERIAMTAPVTQSRTPEGQWRIAFIMPASRDLTDLPQPGSDEVRLQRLPPHRAAAIRFSGRATDELLAARESELRTWMGARQLTPTGPPVYAYYNDPFTPGFLRRNEVIIPVASD